MNYKPKDWYNELYRIFSCNNCLFTQTQAVKIGSCLKSLAAGENITYKLEDLYQSFQGKKKIAEALENFLHRYIDNVKKDKVEQKPETHEEDDSDGNLQQQNSSNSGSGSSNPY